MSFLSFLGLNLLFYGLTGMGIFYVLARVIRPQKVSVVVLLLMATIAASQAIKMGLLKIEHSNVPMPTVDHRELVVIQVSDNP